MACRFEKSEDESFCVVCQCTIDAGDQSYAGPCEHKTHEACAKAYVREWRLNHAEDRPPCPTCKSTDAFDEDLFPLDGSPTAFGEERKRRERVAREEQTRSDAETAQALFFEDFGVFVTRRRNALRRRDLHRLVEALQAPP